MRYCFNYTAQRECSTNSALILNCICIIATLKKWLGCICACMHICLCFRSKEYSAFARIHYMAFNPHFNLIYFLCYSRRGMKNKRTLKCITWCSLTKQNKKEVLLHNETSTFLYEFFGRSVRRDGPSCCSCM